MGDEWTRDPTKEQQRYYELLYEVCGYETNTRRGPLILRKKVGFAIFGPPDEESSCQNGHTGYSKDKYKTIKDVTKFIEEVNKEKPTKKHQLNMAIIFVFVQYEKQVLQYPVFRILLTTDTWKFVDTNCRVYSSWNDFLTFNELPEGKFCWPRDGIYSGGINDEVQLEWGVTPAAKPGRKVVQAADTVSTVAALGATAVCAVGLFTPLGPVMAVAGAVASAGGMYNAVRSGTTLIDRGTHGQTINPLNDRQAAFSWLSVAGSVAGVAAGAATSRAADLARSGKVLSSAEQITCNALNVTSLAVNATGVTMGAFCLGERIKEGEVTTLEVFQFSASLLFFAHATVNFQTASQIIQTTQKGTIEDFEKSLRSNRHRKQFKKLAKNTAATGENSMDGNARVIRGIRSIDNKDDFFAGMVRTRKDFGGHKAVFSENGNIIVNGGAEIHPMKLYELGKQQRKEFLSLAKQASQGRISDATFRARFDSVLSTTTAGPSGSNTSQNSGTTEAVNTLTSQLQQVMVGTIIGGREVRLMISVVDELTTRVCSLTKSTTAKWWNLIWNHISRLVKELMDTYNEALLLEKQFHHFVDVGRFNLENGIQMANVFMHFVFTQYDRYSDHIVDLINDIKKSSARDTEELNPIDTEELSPIYTEELETMDAFCPLCGEAM